MGGRDLQVRRDDDDLMPAPIDEGEAAVHEDGEEGDQDGEFPQGEHHGDVEPLRKATSPHMP